MSLKIKVWKPNPHRFSADFPKLTLDEAGDSYNYKNDSYEKRCIHTVSSLWVCWGWLSNSSYIIFRYRYELFQHAYIFIRNSVFYLSLELLTKFWKTSLKVALLMFENTDFCSVQLQCWPNVYRPKTFESERNNKDSSTEGSLWFSRQSSSWWPNGLISFEYKRSFYESSFE